jgi:uncharacterized protein
MKMNALNQFIKKSYLNLETFRKNGESIKTPVWFVQQDNLIYIYTGANSGKVKRIRHDGRVSLVPCNAGGKPLGTWVPAQAREVRDQAIKDQIDKLLEKKYGLMKKLFFRRNSAQEITVLEVKLDE